jgi:excisionase family DNA binding protein
MFVERVVVVEMATSEAARRLGVDPSRVRMLVRSGRISGRKLGSVWLVDEHDVALLASRRSRPGRPLAPQRAWALLNLLEGGSAPWLTAVARSQVRALVRGLGGADADRWRAILQARSDVLRCRTHPSAVRYLVDDADVVPAGPAEAARQGIDLVVLDPVPEIYVSPSRWPGLRDKFQVVEKAREPNLVVRLPRHRWPFEPAADPGTAVLAADLLESAEPRAVVAGAAQLNHLADQAARARR